MNGRGGTQPGRVPIADHDCTRFLQTALPRLGLRWAGLRKVRGLVCKRLGRRLRELGLAHPAAYLAHLESHPAEWERLGGFCLIPVSRFYRDRCVFERLEREVLPVLAESAVAAGRGELAFWSACCASGEEPYTLAVLWHLRLRHRFPALRLRLVATDVDGHLLERARAGCYGVSSAKELPPDLAAKAFTRHGDELRVRDDFRAIEFLQQDIRRAVPEGAFDLVLCRNAVLTYFAPPVQLEVMGRIARTLRGGGALVTGTHESLPPGLAGLAPWPRAPAIYLRPAGP